MAKFNFKYQANGLWNYEMGVSTVDLPCLESKTSYYFAKILKQIYPKYVMCFLVLILMHHYFDKIIAPARHSTNSLPNESWA